MSLDASDDTRYSASVVDRDTVGCNLLAQSMLEFPILCRNPDVEHRVSMSRPQSASTKEYSVSCPSDAKRSLKSKVFLR
jgi:hypothetical protein